MSLNRREMSLNRVLVASSVILTDNITKRAWLPQKQIQNLWFQYIKQSAKTTLQEAASRHESHFSARTNQSDERARVVNDSGQSRHLPVSSE